MRSEERLTFAFLQSLDLGLEGYGAAKNNLRAEKAVVFSVRR